MNNPTKVLQQAILLRDVRVKNGNQGQAMLYFPDKVGKMMSRSVNPGETLDVTGEYTIEQVKRSSNLEQLVRNGTLKVLPPGQR